MNITYIPGKDRYVDQAGRTASVKDYGRDFIKCSHDFRDIGRRGYIIGGNGKRVEASANQCSKCGVFVVVELV